MSNNPQVKFQPDYITRVLLEKQASFHSIGVNSSATQGSANELCKLVMTRFSRIAPRKVWLALAALEEFVAHSPATRSGPARSYARPE